MPEIWQPPPGFGRLTVPPTTRAFGECMADIEEILNGDIESLPAEDPEKVEPPTEPEEAKDEEQETTAETKGEEETPEPEAPAASIEDLQKQIGAFKAQAIDERRKRQALESEQREKAPIPDAIDDPKGHTEALRQEINQAIINERANLSEYYARQKHENFDELWSDVEGFLSSNPEAYREVMSTVDPYGKAIELFNQSKMLDEMKDPDYLQKLESKIEQRLLSKLQAEQEAKAEKMKSIAPSLAKQAGTGTGAKTWTGPTPLSDIL